MCCSCEIDHVLAVMIETSSEVDTGLVDGAYFIHDALTNDFLHLGERPRYYIGFTIEREARRFMKCNYPIGTSCLKYIVVETFWSIWGPHVRIFRGLRTRQAS